MMLAATPIVVACQFDTRGESQLPDGNGDEPTDAQNQQPDAAVLPLVAPALTIPIQGQATATSPGFAWRAVGQASYILEVGTTPTFETTAWQRNVGPHLSAAWDRGAEWAGDQEAPSQLVIGQTYFWRVTAFNSRESVRSEVRRFAIAPVSGSPEAPLLVAPANAGKATTTPMLRWQRAIGTEAYEVQLSTTPNFATDGWTRSEQKLEARYTGATGGWSAINATTPPPELTPGTTYYWRILASNRYGDAITSVRSFTVAN